MSEVRDLLEKRLKIAQEMVKAADSVYPNEVMRCRARLEVVDTQIAILRLEEDLTAPHPAAVKKKGE